jgi:hypothetical protein
MAYPYFSDFSGGVVRGIDDDVFSFFSGCGVCACVCVCSFRKIISPLVYIIFSL